MDLNAMKNRLYYFYSWIMHDISRGDGYGALLMYIHLRKEMIVYYKRIENYHVLDYISRELCKRNKKLYRTDRMDRHIEDEMKLNCFENFEILRRIKYDMGH